MRNTDLYDRLEVQKQEELPTILTPAEVMDILGVGKNTVYRLLNSGQLPAIRIGRSWKINLLSLSALFPIPNKALLAKRILLCSLFAGKETG